MKRASHWLLVAVSAALLACVPRTRAPSASASASASAAASASASATASASASASAPWSRGGSMTILFLDVGQGDAALLTTSDRHALLVDAGPPEGAARVASALAALGRDTLDAVVLSHAHADHLGDLAHLASALPLERWIDAGYGAHAVSAYPRALAALRGRGIPIVTARRGDHFLLGANVEIAVLEPREPLLERTRSDLNANSVVFRATHHARGGDVRVLFEGDAEHPTERRLLEDDRAGVRADVLKVAHHGSRHASSAAMLDAVAPRLAVISCGLGNDYGHPHAETLRRLAADHAAIARTDLEGDVTVTSDGRGLRWAVARERSAADLLVPGVLRRPGGEAEAP